jgi:uridine kinase
MKYDVFISHASEDKESVAIPLKEKLEELGIRVWIDNENLMLGDSLREGIEKGLSESRYAVVIFSKAFFEKKWTNNEVNALFQREKGKKIILPVLHDVTLKEFEEKAPMLADKLTVSTLDRDLDGIAQQVNLSIRRKSFSDQKSFVVGIAGGSCSGKTWFAKRFKELCESDGKLGVCLFDLDGYYREWKHVRNLQYTHDNPDSINFEAALIHLTELKNGKKVDIPVYDFERHRTEGTRSCEPADIIVVEGVFSFTRLSLLEQFDVKVWLEADSDIRFARRRSRDIQERGRDIREIMQRYRKHVKPGYQKFIHETQFAADLSIRNEEDDSSTPTGMNILLSHCYQHFKI